MSSISSRTVRETGWRVTWAAPPAVFTGSLDTAGKSLTTGNWQPFIGLLDELKIYKRGLTEREIEETFRQSEARYTSPRFTVEWD